MVRASGAMGEYPRGIAAETSGTSETGQTRWEPNLSTSRPSRISRASRFTGIENAAGGLFSILLRQGQVCADTLHCAAGEDCRFAVSA